MFAGWLCFHQPKPHLFLLRGSASLDGKTPFLLLCSIDFPFSDGVIFRAALSPLLNVAEGKVPPLLEAAGPPAGRLRCLLQRFPFKRLEDKNSPLPPNYSNSIFPFALILLLVFLTLFEVIGFFFSYGKTNFLSFFFFSRREWARFLFWTKHFLSSIFAGVVPGTWPPWRCCLIFSKLSPLSSAAIANPFFLLARSFPFPPNRMAFSPGFYAFFPPNPLS